MPALDDIVSVSITLQSAQISRASFGVPLVAGYHTHWSELARTYSASSALSTLVTEGFATTDPVYRAVQAVLSANPRPAQVMVGRRAGAWTQIVRFVPTVQNSAVYSLKVNGTTVSFTSDGSATLAEICTGLAAAIDAAALVTATGASGTHVDVTTTAAGTLATYTDLSSNLALLDVTADAGIAADLTAIRAFSAAWYLLVLDSNATADILAAAEWAEAQKVVFLAQSADSGILTSAATDVASLLQDESYTRTALLYYPAQNVYGAARWVGGMGPEEPEKAEMWEFETLSGVAVTTLSDSAIANLRAKNANYYITLGGLNVTQGGMMSSKRFIDQTILVDWVTARVQETTFAFLLTKPPYTDRSVAGVVAGIYRVLQQGVDAGGINAGGNDIDPPNVLAPKVADVDPLDRAERHLPDVSFSAQTAGGIRSVAISGLLSV